jgi:hypothetical protein
MLMKVMIGTSLVLLLFSLTMSGEQTYRLIVQFVVCATAVNVIAHALRSNQWYWATAFLLVALSFNPILPLPLSIAVFISLNAATFLLFLCALTVNEIRSAILGAIPSEI